MKLNIISVCESDGKIIGCAHMIPKRMKIGERVFISSIGADVAVHPDFRRMNIFKKMNELRIELGKKKGNKILLFISDNPILKKFYKKIYHCFPNTIMDLVKIDDIDRHLQVMHYENVLLKKYSFHMFKLFNKFRARDALSVSSSSDNAFSILKICRFDDGINLFLDEINNHYTFIVERNKDYLNWRYCDPRGGDYIIKMAKNYRKILGYIVLRINKYMKDYKVGYIVDLITLQDRLDVANSLVADAVNYFSDRNINIIHCLVVKNHPYERIYKRHGFVYSRYNLNIFFSPHKTIYENLGKLKKSSAHRVHFVYGDYDVI